MPPSPTQPGTVFSLDTLTAHLGSYKPPTGTFAPGGSWAQSWDIYTLAGGVGHVCGSLEMTRVPKEPGRFVLKIEHMKTALMGARQTTSASILCQADPLATPLEWDFSATTLDGRGEAVPHTQITKQGRLETGGILLTGPSGERRYAVQAPVAMNWGLFEAVQRLDMHTQPLAFTLIDHFDQVKAGQVLKPRENLTATLGARKAEREVVTDLEKGRVRRLITVEEPGTPVAMQSFGQTGRGIVPWIYWRDAQGRLLFASSGIEAYMLRTA